MCMKENETLGHPSEALGVLLWHKGVRKPIQALSVSFNTGDRSYNLLLSQAKGHVSNC